MSVGSSTPLFGIDGLFFVVFMHNLKNKKIVKDSLHFPCLTGTIWKFIRTTGAGGILLLEYLSYSYGSRVIYDPC